MTTLSLPWYSLRSRRTRRWALNIGGGIAVALTAAYALLPWYVPTDWLARRIAANLEAQFGRPVRVQGVSLSWTQGVCIEGVVIESLPKEGHPPLLARVRRVRCGLTPLRTVLDGRVDRLELAGAEFWVSLLPGGRLNIDDLPERRRRKLPTLNYMLRDATLHLDMPDLPAQFRIDRLGCRIDPTTGLLRVYGDAVTRPRSAAAPGGVAGPSGRYWIDGRLKVPRLRRDVQLTGGGRLRWEGVRLDEIPFYRFPRLGVERIEGRSDGWIDITAHPDLGVDYDVDVTLAGVAVHRRGHAEPAKVGDAEFAGRGHWDPAVDSLVADALACRLPSFHVRGTGQAGRPAVVIDARGTEPLRVDLVGAVDDFALLRQRFPVVDAFLGRFGVELAHSCTFSVRASRDVHRDRGQFAIDATKTTLDAAEAARLPAGVRKTLVLDASRDADGRRIVVHEARIEVGDLRASAEGVIPLPAGAGPPDRAWWSEAAGACELTARLATPRVEEVAELLPGVDRWLGAGRRHGPVEASLHVGPTVAGPTGHWRIAAAAESELNVRDWFAKPAGEAFVGRGSFAWDGERLGLLRDATMDVQLGTARIALDQQAVELDATELDRADGGWQGAVRARVPVRITQVERWVAACPAMGVRLARTGFGPLAARGDLDVTLAGALVFGAGELVCDATISADAAAAAVRAGEWLDKSAGAPLSLRGRARYARDEQSMAIRAEGSAALPGLSLSATYEGARNEPAGAIEPQAARLVAEVHDAEKALSVWPRLAALAQETRFAGTARAELAAALGPDRATVEAAVDATALEVAPPTEPAIQKSAGVACRVAVTARAETKELSTWHLNRVVARLANVEGDATQGQIALAPEWVDWLEAVRDGARREPPPRAPIVSGSADLTVRGEMDAALRGLSPVVATWMERYGLVGRFDGTLAVHADDDALSLASSVDLTDANLRTDAGDGLVVTKPIGMRAEASARATARRGAADGVYALAIEDACVRVQDNVVHASGGLDLSLAWEAGAPVSSPAGRICIEANLARVDQVQALWPELEWPPTHGAVTAHATCVGDAQGWVVGEADIALADVAFTADGVPVRADGTLTLTPEGLSAEAATIAIGDSRVDLAGRVSRDAGEPAARIGLFASRPDVDAIIAVAKHLADRIRVSGGSYKTSGHGESRLAERLWAWLRRADVDVQAYANDLQLTIPDLDHRATLPVAQGSVRGADGVLEMPLRIGVDGGVIEGQVAFYLNTNEPYFDLAYVAERLEPKALVAAYLRDAFPGLTATGPMTLIDRSLQRLGAPPDEPNHPVGSGEWIIDGGYMLGKAAPDWLTRVFPGLNLARFDFTRMHDWFTKYEDGRIRHRMVFQGRYYHVYVDGFTDADRRVRYEVGIDLLASLESQYWVESEQGRIPLFIKTGRISKDGTLDPDVVQFLPMTRVLETLLVQNNVAITIYHAIRKQVLAARERKPPE
jgi:hypothetical protein